MKTDEVEKMKNGQQKWNTNNEKITVNFDSMEKNPFQAI